MKLSLLIPGLLAAAQASAVVGVNASQYTVDPKAPEAFFVDFHTDIDGDATFTMNVTRSWAPLGVDHFYALLNDNFYNEAAFFRVVGGFVLQFGIAGEPKENVKWAAAIPDDPVTHSNLQHTMSYATAGPNTRTTQLFINYADNTDLDKQGFAPFAQITSGANYIDQVHDPTPGDSDGVDQTKYETLGNTWIKEEYPMINFIKKTTIRLP